MSEPKGYIANDPVAMGVWKRLTELFAVWRLVVIAAFTRRALMQYSNDQMSTLMRTGHWKIGLGLLAGLTDAQVDFLAVWAQLNAERSERIFRTTALILVTIPVAGVFGLSEVDPDIWERFGFERLDFLVALLGLWMLACAVMMAAAWRARDLADLLVLEQGRRGLKRANPGAAKP